MASIGELNRIFKTQGPEAAIAYAEADDALRWTVAKIRADTWDPDFKEKQALALALALAHSQEQERLERERAKRKERTVRKGKTERDRKRGVLARHQENLARRAEEYRDRAGGGSGGGSNQEK